MPTADRFRGDERFRKYCCRWYRAPVEIDLCSDTVLESKGELRDTTLGVVERDYLKQRKYELERARAQMDRDLGAAEMRGGFL